MKTALMTVSVEEGRTISCLGGCGEAFFTIFERRRGIGICAKCKARNRGSRGSKVTNINGHRAGRDTLIFDK